MTIMMSQGKSKKTLRGEEATHAKALIQETIVNQGSTRNSSYPEYKKTS